LGDDREDVAGGHADRVALPARPTVLDILRAANRSDPASLEGRFVEIVGQCDVVGDLPDGRFDVYRLVVTCCVADASAVSLEVAPPVGVRIESGSWVRVAGLLKFDGSYDPSMPVLHATKMSRIPAPSEPYLSTPS
jgi:uncharacterized repeat protein (TIGR03943 family)